MGAETKMICFRFLFDLLFIVVRCCFRFVSFFVRLLNNKWRACLGSHTQVNRRGEERGEERRGEESRGEERRGEDRSQERRGREERRGEEKRHERRGEEGSEEWRLES